MEIDLTAGFIKIWFIKLPIQDLIVYIGAIFGFYKNYRANMKIFEKQIEQQAMKEEEREEARKKARRDYIYQNAKAHFLKIEQIAAETEIKGDDKLVLYFSKFIDGMQTALGETPSKGDQEIMKDKAQQYSIENKIEKGIEVSPVQEMALKKDIQVDVYVPSTTVRDEDR